jgi:hypothetical protein
VGAGPTLSHGSAAPPKAKPAVVVLDDCDPHYDKGKSQDDGIRPLATDGKEIARIGGLNNCQRIAMNHGVALDAERDRIYVSELVEQTIRSISRFGSSAKILFESIATAERC